MTPSKSELLSDLALIQEAYSAEPKLPDSFRLIGMIRADPAATAALLAMDNSVHLPFFKKLLTPDMAWWGFVAFDTATETAHLDVRGTETELEWAGDACAIQVPWRGGTPNSVMRVHEGFQLIEGVLESSVIDLLHSVGKLQPRQYRINAHSLGCPISSLIRLLITGPVSVRLWEPPRLGNAEFCAMWNDRTPDAIAIKNHFDIVPMLPPEVLGFHDLAQDLRISGGGSFLDFKTAHNLQLGCKPGIEALP